MKKEMPRGVSLVSIWFYVIAFLLILPFILRAHPYENYYEILSLWPFALFVIFAVVTAANLRKGKIWAKNVAILLLFIILFYEFYMMNKRLQVFFPFIGLIDFMVMLLNLFTLGYLIFDKKVKAYFS